MAYKKGNDHKWRGIKGEQPEWYRRTEMLLYAYPGMESRVKMLELELEEVRERLTPRVIGRYQVVEGKDYGGGNRVEKEIIDRIENREVLRLQKAIRQTKRMKKAVENAVEKMLTQEERDIVRWLYWENMGWEEVCEILNLTRHPFYRRKTGLMNKLGWCFGYLSDKEYGLKRLKSQN